MVDECKEILDTSRTDNSVNVWHSNNSVSRHVCSTCKEEIDSEISRILIMRDIDGGPRLLCFHFFFPCWSFELLCKKYPDLIIDKAGFSIPVNILIKKNSIKNMQKNLELWI